MNQRLLHLLVWLSFMVVVESVAAQVSGANIVGRVRDEAGAAIVGASVEVVQTATGLRRETVTGSDGGFGVTNLPPGPYRVTVRQSGFATQVQEVSLVVGQSATLVFTMKVAPVEETITVEAAPPLVETTTATLHKAIDQEQVQNLPINGRDFTTLAALIPGVTTGNRAVNQNYDPVKRRVPAISINGQSGRNINMLIDGMDNTDIFMGGQNIMLSLEAVREFDVITHDPKAQYSRGIGGVINVVTKSGTNHFHGSAFGFFRDDSLQSNDAITESLGKPKPPFDSQQFGGTIGGPLKKDRAFFFFSYERQQEDRSRVFNSGGAFPELDGTVTPQPFRQNMYLVRVDGRVSDAHSVFVRYAEQDNKTLNLFFSDNDAPDSSADEFNKLHDVTAGWSALIGSNRVNDFRFHFQWFENLLQNKVSSLEVPTLIFPAATFGASQAGTQNPKEITYQIRDDFSWTIGRHNLRFGGSLIIQPEIGIKGDFRHNRFLFANNDYDPATNTIGPTNQVLNYRSWSSPRFDIVNKTLRHYGLYIQDDIRLGRVNISAGLRYDFVQNLFYNRGTLAEQIVRENVGKVPGGPKRTEPQDDKDNIAPRIGVAIDLTGDGRAVLRAGYARLYDPSSILASTLFADLEVPQRDGSPPFNFVFVPGSLLDVFGIVPGQIFDASTLPFSFPIGFVNSPDMKVAHADQVNVGFSYEIASGPAAGLTFDVDFAFSRTRDLTQGRNLNFCLNPDCTEVNFPQAGEFPLVGIPRQIFLEDTTGRNDYKGLIFSVRRRFANRWQVFGSYTLSKAETDTNQFTFVVLDQLHPNAPDEFGPTELDERHRVVFSSIVLLPGDVQLSTIFTGASARPYTPGTNGDLNGDGVPTVFGAITNGPGGSRTFNSFEGDRSAPRGSLRGDPTYSLDLRISKLFRIERWGPEAQFEVMFEVFNLTDAANFGQNFFDNIDDPERFGTPINIITPPRTAQIGVRFRF